MADKKREESGADHKPEDDDSKGQYGGLKSLGSGGGHRRDEATPPDNDPVDPGKDTPKPA